MYVVAVIPFLRGSQVDTLTYYAGSVLEIGTIVTIPIRKSTARALVIDCKPVSVAKTALRAATFSLRRLPEQEQKTKLPEVLIKTTQELTQTLPTTQGALLYSFLPPEVRDGRYELPASENQAHRGTSDIALIQDTTEERYRTYQSRIREAFAHRGSVLFVVPTTADVERAHEILATGIEDRIAVFSPIAGTKKLQRAYESFRDVSVAKLVITTPKHAFLDRHDFTTIIIEQSRNPFYKSRIRPYVDTRSALVTLARCTGRSVLFGDLLPHCEHEYARREEFFNTEGEHPKRLLLQGKLTFIHQQDKPSAEEPFELFSKELRATIKRTTKARRNMLLLAARRGIAPIVLCADCGHIFRCPDSDSPYALLRTVRNNVEERWFISSTSGKRVRAADVCSECGSWRLRERGLGIQFIHEAFQKQFPDIPIVLFDHTTATTYKKARALITEFSETKGGILLATPMVFPYLDVPVERSAVISLDATRAAPTWRADEELLALLLSLRERSMSEVIVQSRAEKDTLITYAERGSVEQFYDDELALRESLHYPPFSHLLLCTYARQLAESVEPLIQSAAEPFAATFYHAATHTQQSTTKNALIRIPRDTWPNQSVIDKVRALPPSVRIELDPHRIV